MNEALFCVEGELKAELAVELGFRVGCRLGENIADWTDVGDEASDGCFVECGVGPG